MTILVGVGSDKGHQLGNRWTVQAEEDVSTRWKKQDDVGARVSVKEVSRDQGSGWSGNEGISANRQRDASSGIEERLAYCQGVVRDSSPKDPSSASSPKRRQSHFLSDTYKTVIHSAHVPIGHPTSRRLRHVAFSTTSRTPCTEVATNFDTTFTHVPLEQANRKKPRQQALRKHTWPLSSKGSQVTGRWGGAGHLGVAEPDLEILKRERRAKRAARQKQKQLLRGEITSWEPDNKDTNTSPSSASNSSSWELAEGTPHGWSSDACTPISDEDWGEDRDWGGVPADLSELMIIDEEKPENWCNAGEEKAAWDASGLPTSDSGFTITLRPSSGAQSPDEPDLLFDDREEEIGPSSDMDIAMDSAREAHINLADSPPPPLTETFTPLSPALSPEPTPSAMDLTESLDARALNIHTPPSESLFSSFSAIRLGTPRKRSYPDEMAQDLTGDGMLATETNGGAGQDLHPKKKRSPGVD